MDGYTLQLIKDSNYMTYLGGLKNSNQFTKTLLKTLGSLEWRKKLYFDFVSINLDMLS